MPSRRRRRRSLARDDGAAQVARAVEWPAVRQTSSCWRSDCGTVSCSAAQRFAASGDSIGSRWPSSGPTARRNGQTPASCERPCQPGQPARRVRDDRAGFDRRAIASAPAPSAARTSSAVQSSAASAAPGRVGSAGRPLKRRSGRLPLAAPSLNASIGAESTGFGDPVDRPRRVARLASSGSRGRERPRSGQPDKRAVSVRLVPFAPCRRRATWC